MLEKVGYGFCSDWFHKSNENPVKTSEVDRVNGLQYFCKKRIASIQQRLTQTPRF